MKSHAVVATLLAVIGLACLAMLMLHARWLERWGVGLRGKGGDVGHLGDPEAGLRAVCRAAWGSAVARQTSNAVGIFARLPVLLWSRRPCAALD